MDSFSEAEVKNDVKDLPPEPWRFSLSIWRWEEGLLRTENSMYMTCSGITEESLAICEPPSSTEQLSQSAPKHLGIGEKTTTTK